MRAIRNGLLGALVLGMLLALSALHGSAGAQTYPPPVGSLTTQTSTTTPSIGGTTTITAILFDASGNPVANTQVLLQIESQPGTGATFPNGQTQTTAFTDANGKVTTTLSVGNTPGNIIVKAISGDKVSQVSLQVQKSVGAVPPSGGPPASEDRGGLPARQLLIAAGIAAGIVALLSGSVILARRRRT